MNRINRDEQRWDRLAGQFDALPVPDWERDPFLRILSELPVWDSEPQALDLGCGAGRYSIALAPKCAQVLGTDLSPEMIGFANRKKELFHADNSSFVCEDWDAVDPVGKQYAGRFDLIIAHMTPALKDLDSLRKMNACSRGWCAMASFRRREAPLQKELLRYLGLQDSFSPGRMIPEFFEDLYRQGMSPRVSYYERDDSRKMSPKDAVAFFSGSLHGVDTVSGETELKIRDFVQSHIVDGEVVNPVASDIVVMTWNTVV